MSGLTEHLRQKDWKFRVFVYAAMTLPIMILPVVVRQMDLPFIQNTSSYDAEVFELFDFFAFIGVSIVTFTEVIRRPRSLQNWLPIIVSALVSLHFLTLITGFLWKSKDYLHYQDAAKALLDQRNPYDSGTYLYPPLFVYGITALWHFAGWLGSLGGGNISARMQWELVFYFFQCFQFFLVVIAYLLCYRFARKIGIDSLKATFLIAALFLFNSPLFRTIRHNQVNLLMLDLTLASILLLARRPFLSGPLLAVSAHIKVYPFVLILPWIIARQWRAILWCFLASLMIVAIQTQFFKDWGLWIQCVEFFKHFPERHHFRDNGFYSIIYNFIHLPGFWSGKPSEMLDLLAKWLFRISIVVAILLISKRMLQREAIFRDMTHEEKLDWNERRLFGHCLDGLALSLMIAASVWEHVYVLAMPLFLLAIAVSEEKEHWKVYLVGILIFSVPIFEVFPFSYNRIVGLFLLLYFTRPSRMTAQIAKSQPAIEV